jgi:hypothetical protein
MSDKRVFTIGQLVEVNLNHQAVADYDEKNYRRVKRQIDWGDKRHTDDLVLAKITGVKIFQEGQYTAAYTSSGFLEPPDNEQAYTTNDRSIRTWAVRLGYKNKELYFFKEDISVVHVGEIVVFPRKDLKNIPYFYSGWTGHYRKKLSRESKDWARDKKGRWAKEVR